MEVFLLIAAILVLIGGLSVVVLPRVRDRRPGIEPGPARDAIRAASAPRSGADGTDVTAAATDPAAADAAPDEVTSGEASPADASLTDGDPDGSDADDAAPADAPPSPEPVERPSFRERLSRARSTFSGYLGSVLSRSDITAETWEELEEALIRADVGVALTTTLLDELRATVTEQGLTTPDELLAALKAQLVEKLSAGDRSLRFDGEGTDVWLFVGVNGVGKTTSIGKVARAQVDAGRSVLMAAGDTFRAAAAEQLQTWSERSGTEFHRGEEGGDPSSVIFDAVAKAGAKGIDLVLADTAGRLHTKSNLMDELTKVRRVADRDPGNVTEVLLVLDATTGQNGLQQARLFSEATQCTGVVLTKLDGSAKGGIALAIALDLGLPIKLVGLGEQVGDLIEFDPQAFIDALFEA